MNVEVIFRRKVNIMKKIIFAALIIFVLLCTLVACGEKTEAPEGFQLVSAEEEIFNLYAPKSWNSNLSSGISGAYYSLENKVLVSAKTIRNAPNYTLGEFMAMAIESYEGMEGYELVSDVSNAVLGGKEAYSMEYKATVSGVVYKFKVVNVKYEATFTNLIYSAPEEFYELGLADFDQMIAKFEFKTFSEGEIETDEPFTLVDENTPEGYQIASKDKYEYRLYVPLTWTVQRRSYNPSAYYSTTDLSNVSLMTFVRTEKITDGKAYWDNYAENCDYELSDIVINEDAKMGEYPAMDVEYTVTISGIAYKMKQVFLTTNDMIYIFTYTSNELNFDKHIADVNKMVEMFEFKK